MNGPLPFIQSPTGDALSHLPVPLDYFLVPKHEPRAKVLRLATKVLRASTPKGTAFTVNYIGSIE